MLARKIAYNVFANAIMKVLATMLALISIGFLTRYLGQAGFGDYATVLAFFAFFNALADLGLYATATREISRPQANEKEIISNVFTLRLVVSILILLITPFIIYFFPYSYQIKLGIFTVAIAFIFSSSYMVLNGIFQKRLIMDRVALIEFLGKIVQVSFIILVIWKKLSFNWIIFSLLLFSFFNFSLITFLARRYVKFNLKINWQYWKKFLKMSLPMGGATLITFFYFKTDTILLSLLKGSQAVGVYNGAYKIVENITFFPGMIMGLVLPLISRYIFTKKEKFKQISDKTFKVFFLLVIPLVIGSWFLASNIVLIIGGKEFLSSAPILRILIFSLAFIFFGNLFNNILLAGNMQKKLMQVLFFCAFFNVFANILFIPLYSYWAAAVISLITEAMVVFLTAYLTKKYLNYIPSLNNLSKFILSGAIMAFFLYLSPYHNFIFLLIGSSILYFLMLYITQAITKEEILSIFQK